MICGKCGTSNDSTYQYCMKCGNLLAAPDPSSSGPASISGPTMISHEKTENPIAPNSPGRMRDLLLEGVTPADSETTVRTYYCTYYRSKLLGLEASGYLAVTNKRVIFQAQGTSNGGKSILQSEVPVAEVSGISSYKGTYFSIRHLLLAAFVAALTQPLIVSIITAIGFTTRSEEAFIVTAWVIALLSLLGTLGVPRESIWKPILAAASASSFAIAGGGSLLSFGRGSFANVTEFPFLLAGITGIYLLFCAFWYARRPTFSMAISSKGGSSTPINIAGATGLGITTGSAIKALSAEPAEDSETLLRELGALILDIQMLGDMGITKWKS